MNTENTTSLDIEQATITIRKIAARLKDYAQDNDWCGTYDEEIDTFRNGSKFDKLFYAAANRLVPTTVSATLLIHISAPFVSGPYAFSTEVESTEEGVYLLPDGFEPDGIDDLADAELVGGTDLVEWLANADQFQVEVDDVGQESIRVLRWGSW